MKKWGGNLLDLVNYVLILYIIYTPISVKCVVLLHTWVPAMRLNLS